MALITSAPHLLPELWDVHYAGSSTCAAWASGRRVDEPAVTLAAPCALRFRPHTEAPPPGQSLELLLSLLREARAPPHSAHAVLISTAARPPPDARRRPFTGSDEGVLVLWDELSLSISSSLGANSSSACLGVRRGGSHEELRLRISVSSDSTVVRHGGCGSGTASPWEAALSLGRKRVFVHLFGLAPSERAAGEATRAGWGVAQLRETCHSAACDGGSRLSGGSRSDCGCGCLDSWEAVRNYD